MEFKFAKGDYEAIASVLGVKPVDREDHVRFTLTNEEAGRRLSLDIYSDLAIGQGRGSLVSVYTDIANLQLHFCTGYVVSEMLGEVTFIGEHEGRLSGIIIERGAGCSVYANVDKSILSGDFTTLGPEVMLSGIALSLTEELSTDA